MPRRSDPTPTDEAALRPVPPSETAARRELLAEVRAQGTGLEPAVLVELALRASEGAHHGVAQAALAALNARVAQARAEDLRLAGRSPWAPRVVVHHTRVRGGRARPYRVLVTRTDPFEVSCDCDDYLKNGLGACKHAFVVAGALARTRQRARRGDAADSLARLAWDPRRALTGPGDWMEGLRYAAGQVADPVGARLRTGVGGGRGVWQPCAGSSRLLRLRPSILASAGSRARLLEALGDGLDAQQRARPAARRVLVDPALFPLVAAERERAARLRAGAQAKPGALRSLRGLGRRLYPYQRAGVERFLDQGRLLLADDMGLGKTAQAIAACHALVRSRAIRRALVVVPASLRAQWLQEWTQVSDVPLVPVEGDASRRAALYRSQRRGVLLTHYEQLLRDEAAAVAFAPDLLLLDEAQRIKNWATRTAATVKRIPSPWRLVLTGTPFENRLEELASLLDLIDERALQPLWRLQAWHLSGTASGHAEGARGLGVLRERIAGAVLRRSRQEVLGQLPPRTDTRLPVELTDEQRAAHDDLALPIARLAAMAQRRALRREEFLRLMSLLTTQRIIANGMAQLEFAERWPQLERLRTPDATSLRSLGSPKLLELRELVRQIVVEQGRKMVVFSQWRRMLQLAGWAVRDVLASGGLRAVSFTGAESLAQRSRSVVEFHDDPGVGVLFATDAGGVGLNLQRAATCAVHLELPWNPAVLEQRAARIHRLGQSRPVDVYALVSQDCIESRISDVVGSKRALFQGLFEGSSDEVRFERSESFVARVVRLTEGPPPGSPGDVAGPEERAAADARADELVSATADDAGQAAGAGAPPPVAAVATRTTPSAPGPTPAPARSDATAAPGLQVHREADGRLVIRAEPAEAARLVALLEAAIGGLRLLLPADGDGSGPRQRQGSRVRS